MFKAFMARMMSWPQNTSESDGDVFGKFVGEEVTPIRSYSSRIPIFSPLLEKLEPVDINFPLVDPVIDCMFLMADEKPKCPPVVVVSDKKQLVMSASSMSIPLARKPAISSSIKLKVPPKKAPAASVKKQLVMSASSVSIPLPRKPAIPSGIKLTVPPKKAPAAFVKRQLVMSASSVSIPLTRKPSVPSGIKL
ncbi:hypothetical protein HanRHA438_Chr08g0368991 [Helianthus annuus]|nr:hypothetical protein HanRHA438_Chr08g0368991 [Helianthus annuus]